MPSSLNGTGVTFNDGTQLNSANEAGGNYIMRTFTSPTTWSKPTGLKAVKVTVVGAGGGGGGSGGGRGGFPGGGGGASIRFIPAPSIPGPVTVTRGAGGSGGTPPAGGTPGAAGGTSSFGAFLSATGGAGGRRESEPSPPNAVPAVGGTGSGGDLNIKGGRAFVYFDVTTSLGPNLRIAGARVPGGSSLLSNGSDFDATITFRNGFPGNAFGGGASGAIGGSPLGGTGANGVVIVEEFF